MATRTRHERSSRQPLWLGADLAPTVIASGGKTLLTSLNAAALALRPFTIIRTRLLLHLDTDQGAASESPNGAYARMVVNDQAVGIGSTAIPGPLTNADAPWFVYEGMISNFVFASAVGADSHAGFWVTIDSKAMRKVGNNEDLVSVVELNPTFGGIINVIGRTLVKLH